MIPRSWTAFLVFLFFSVMLYILALNGFITFKEDIIVNNYFTTLGKNYTKFRFPKPVHVPPVEQNTVPANNENKQLQNTKSLTNTKKRENRPRNTTDYEKGHRDLCKNSWQEDYTKLHQNMIKANKFIVFRCPKSGWGNRLRLLLSTFHFSVVARRAFIINCDAPSPLDRYLAPRNIKWNYKVDQTNLTVRKGYKVILNNIKNASDHKIFEQILSYSVEYAPALMGNNYQWLANLVRYRLPAWPNIRQMLGCSFYYLFKKSDMLQKRLDEWKEELGFNENIVIAIHIRQGDSVFHHNQGDKRFKDPKDLYLSFDCAAQIEKKVEEKYKTKNIIWFLAADSEKIKTYAKTKYGNKVKYITGPIEHIGHPTKGNEDAGQFTMFLDYFLMQEADYRLYTGSSTFDSAIDYITLGTGNACKKSHQCTIPSSLKG